MSQKQMDIRAQADKLIHRIKHFLITQSGRRAENATVQEFYVALSTVLREEAIINWTAALDTFHTKKVRTLNFLSMEYLPGRLLANQVTNINGDELVKTTLARLNLSYGDVISCEPDQGLGNGGLGRLSACFLDSLATLHYPARGYGLRYQYGIFEQEIWNGEQVERPDCWLLNQNPWECRRDLYAVNIHFSGKPLQAQNRHGDDVYLIEYPETVRALPFDTPIIGFAKTTDFTVLTLRLWSTKESPRNFELQRYNAGFLGQAAENTNLTDVLYPNDNTELGKRVRLKQEFLLASASLQDILRRHVQCYGDLSELDDKVRIQINDTHPAFIIAEMVRTLTKNYDFSWEKAWTVCQACCSYTNHSILKESLEEWNEQRVKDLIPRQYKIIEQLNQQFCDQIRSRYPSDEQKVRRMSILEDGQARLAHLAIVGSHKVNGVAKLHTEILKKDIFPDFAEAYPDKFIDITNGVTQRRWLLSANLALSQFITDRIGPDWICDFTQIRKLASFASDKISQEAFLAIKRKNKEALIDFLKKENPLRDAAGNIVSQFTLSSPDALFDVHIKRFHEYKRQLLNALHLIMVYQELKANSNTRSIHRISIFSGKSAPGYAEAKRILHLIACLARTINGDPALQNRLSVVFIENYNVSRAEVIIPAADLSEQISTAGWEASGTGNMKLAMNGALTIGTEDGANIEMRQAIGDEWWPFSFGASAKENKKPYKPWDLYIQHPQIQKAIDSLKEGIFSTTSEETGILEEIYRSLIETDTYRVLQDLPSYYETQKKVEKLFLNPSKWAETAIHNIAGMGPFSADDAMRRYAGEIWGLSPCPTDIAILNKIREEYSGYERCQFVR
ncbi:MAG: glycogen/starch/alpha-glucan family phosphorylase [Chlamydiae bacterium]|nr:glycogen/starch/alpha-glucan family phosphorylase [Chlamydiota bacterium]